MKLGFTGTQHGMTSQQKDTAMLYAMSCQPKEAHMGDCVGADKEFHDIIHDINKKFPAHKCATIGHIPIYDTKRAFCLYDVVKEPKPYLERNHEIVNSCDILIAAPKESYEQQRSGTWATVRYAKKKNKPVVIVYPNGDMEELN